MCELFRTTLAFWSNIATTIEWRIMYIMLNKVSRDALDVVQCYLLLFIVSESPLSIDII
jgi:hypothetical protein